MTRIAILITVLCIAFPPLLTAAEVVDQDLPEIVKWYRVHYPFTTNKDSIFTFETEFKEPSGYNKPDSSDQTPFQNWMSNFPLWHRWRPVGNWKGQKYMEADSVSRPVHLPWVGKRFTDCAIPIRILGEWLHYQKRENDLEVSLTHDGHLSYAEWLSGKMVHDNHMRAFIQPGEVRPPSEKEFYAFLARCMENTDYSSLRANCDSIDCDDLMPGDLLIGHDERGTKGVVYVVLRVLKNLWGSHVFAVATGGAEACDFHIPKLTDDRDRPWIDQSEAEKLVASFPHHGCFRLRLADQLSQ
ncbi:MAG TPA: DUF4846 domain-containing protein [candidate division Zixibacteria bacterium]|nr:DUF4846 domain-containing protein [candidate division Zixibacteria bacterium]